MTIDILVRGELDPRWAEVDKTHKWRGVVRWKKPLTQGGEWLTVGYRMRQACYRAALVARGNIVQVWVG